jgi:hypothetical protein
MFKAFTAISLLALLGGGESAAPASPWPAIFTTLMLIAAILTSLVWLRNRFRILRRSVSEMFTQKRHFDPVISDEAWKRITSGEMAKRLTKKEK